MMMAVIAGAVLVGASSVCANASSMKNETLSSVNSDVENVEITIPGDEGEEVNVDGSGDMQIIKTEDGYGVSVKLINSTADNVTKNKKIVKIVSAKAGDKIYPCILGQNCIGFSDENDEFLGYLIYSSKEEDGIEVFYVDGVSEYDLFTNVAYAS